MNSNGASYSVDTGLPRSRPMSSPLHEMKLLKPACVLRLPAGSPSISSVPSRQAGSIACIGAGGGGTGTSGPACTADAQPTVALRHRPVGDDHMVLAADVHVVDQPAVADEQAVAAGGVAVGDQHALASGRSMTTSASMR